MATTFTAETAAAGTIVEVWRHMTRTGGGRSRAKFPLVRLTREATHTGELYWQMEGYFAGRKDDQFVSDLLARHRESGNDVRVKEVA